MLCLSLSKKSKRFFRFVVSVHLVVLFVKIMLFLFLTASAHKWLRVPEEISAFSLKFVTCSDSVGVRTWALVLSLKYMCCKNSTGLGTSMLLQTHYFKGDLRYKGISTAFLQFHLFVIKHLISIVVLHSDYHNRFILMSTLLHQHTCQSDVRRWPYTQTQYFNNKLYVFSMRKIWSLAWVGLTRCQNICDDIATSVDAFWMASHI